MDEDLAENKGFSRYWSLIYLRKDWLVDDAKAIKRTRRYVEWLKKPYRAPAWCVDWASHFGFFKEHQVRLTLSTEMRLSMDEKCDLIRVRKGWITMTDKTYDMFVESMKS
jgi:hypothetical protein